MPTAQVVLTIAIAAVTAHGSQPIQWAQPLDGAWNNPANWNPAVVPGVAQGALLAFDHPYAVSVTTNVLVGSLSIPNSLATLVIQPGRTLGMLGPVVNDAVIEINPTNADLDSALRFHTSASISGSGLIRLGGETIRARILSTSAASIVTHEPPHTIAGFGRIEAVLVNNALISADRTFRDLIFTTHPVVNNGTIEARNRALLRFLNIDVDQGPDGLIVLEDFNTVANLFNATIRSGALRASGGAEFKAPGDTTLDAVTLSGPLTLFAGSTLSIANGLTLDQGILHLGAVSGGNTLAFQDRIGVHGEGEIRLLGPIIVTGPAGPGEPIPIGSGVRLTGAGTIDTDLIIEGTISPGFENAGGTLFARRLLTFTESTVFDAHLDGRGRVIQQDTFTQPDAMQQLDGTLVLTVGDGYEPQTGDRVTIIRRPLNVPGVFEGRFHTVVTPTPPDPRLAYRVEYDPRSVSVTLHCVADMNDDGQLNIFDFFFFTSLWESGDPAADLNGDGLFNFFDFVAYLNLFNQGCP
ncbi:MAG: hypothetical protein LAT64_13685 [Phycisphaerales bacterium]|nr:hypothetical protein [Planctomycetota bacterium]MCH8509803.1 hypothetical protein [Phycisphaerales bacterium]